MDTIHDHRPAEAENQAEPFFLHPENREFVEGGSTKPIIGQKRLLVPFFFYSLAFALSFTVIASLFEFYLFSPFITGLLAFPLAFITLYIPSRLSYLRFLREGQLLERPGGRFRILEDRSSTFSRFSSDWRLA